MARQPDLSAAIRNRRDNGVGRETARSKPLKPTVYLSPALWADVQTYLTSLSRRTHRTASLTAVVRACLSLLTATDDDTAELRQQLDTYVRKELRDS